MAALVGRLFLQLGAALSCARVVVADEPDVFQLRGAGVAVAEVTSFDVSQAAAGAGEVYPAAALALLNAADVAFVLGVLTDTAVDKCLPPAQALSYQLKELIKTSCNRTREAVSNFKALAASYGGNISSSWASRSAAAGTKCNMAEMAEATGNFQQGAALALAAWADDLMQGRECCNLLYPPYCLSQKTSSKIGHMVPLLIMVGIVLMTFVAPYICRKSVSMPNILRMEDAVSARRSDGPRPTGHGSQGSSAGQPADSALERELQGKFMESSMRVLPESSSMAAQTAALFCCLYKAVGFQRDSVVNQYEHFVSLLRSQISMVADDNRQMTLREETLIPASVTRLKRDLLAGLDSYRRKLFAVEQAIGTVQRGVGEWQSVPFAGAWAHAPSEQPQAAALAEVAAYLLVWGEAGNIRFMPELVCFITDLLLRADLSGDVLSTTDGRSGRFLVRVIRPIYEVVFEENYENVTIHSGKDAKKLKTGYDKFLPADCANYDDWNELFCDPTRLVDAVVLRDGTNLFNKPPGQRFALLERVDWHATLANCKTHREVHSPAGLFAACHRVVFLHVALYLCTFALVASSPILPPDGAIAMVGNDWKVRFATTGLLVPLHGFVWNVCAFATSGVVLRRAWSRGKLPGCETTMAGMMLGLRCLLRLLCWSAPIATYALVRRVESDPVWLPSISASLSTNYVDFLHCFVCMIGVMVILEFPGSFTTHTWHLTPAPCGSKLLRWAFWLTVLFVKALVGSQGVHTVNKAMNDLSMTRVGLEPISDISTFAFSPHYDKDFAQWCVFMVVGLLVYSADTQFWFSLGCSFLGILVGMQQRRWAVHKLCFADIIAQIPQTFSQKVLFYAPIEGNARYPASFPVLWGKIVQHFLYEDKVDGVMAGNLAILELDGRPMTWQALNEPLSQMQQEGRATVTVPYVFREKSASDRFCRDAGCAADVAWPKNADVLWRLNALARGLSLTMPRPFRPPYIPGLTVLIPHYGESILLEKKDLFPDNSKVGDVVPLMSWLAYRYQDEFENFINRMARPEKNFTKRGHKWTQYSNHEWDKLIGWASMRSQTLWRTVAGMMLYHQSLRCHYQLQADKTCSLGNKDVWNTKEVFTCMISMQMYAHFNPIQLKHTNMMFEKFPQSLKVAFIDYDEKDDQFEQDGVHPKQARRFFSCLIDKNCKTDEQGKKKPRLRIELPGFPILGDGKGDNQNHAIPFTRGMFIQAIDANQGAYFEQMLLLPNVLGEFRDGENGKGTRKIVGFPEHITSDFGSIGDFAAGAETAFGTILQRSYAALGGRMHYGHPDMMNKMFMMQQGGVSKATKTVNLSEDIFAGMDFTLRGEGRTIQHTEYFHVSKGRDLGFNTVLLFFSKLSAGTGEQVLTRQTCRLGERLDLPEFLTFWYAHGGFYVTQFLLSMCVPALVFVWLVVLLDASEDGYSSMAPRFSTMTTSNASVMATVLVGQYGWLFLLFIIAGAAPLLFESWLQFGVVQAWSRLIKQMMTLAPLHFIFQAKVIGYYISSEVLYGGASYVSTGRGLPIERRAFIGIKGNVAGLYNDFAQIAFYDGVRLLTSLVLVGIAGGVSSVSSDMLAALVWWFLALALTLLSWLWAPFIFNPYQFDCRMFKEDTQQWWNFFVPEPAPWKDWYEKTQLRAGLGLRSSPASVISWVVFVGAFWVVLENKIHMMTIIFPGTGMIFSKYLLGIAPPIVLSVSLCMFLPASLDRMGRNNLPLIGYVGLVLALDAAESALEMNPLMYLGWWKTTLACLVVKYSLVSACLCASECSFRLKGDGRSCEFFWNGIKLWLFAHRMARDVLCSAFIYAFLSLGVFMDWFRRSVLQLSPSPHNVLVYRDPGHPSHASEEIDLTCQARDQDYMVEGSGSFAQAAGGEGVSLSVAAMARAEAWMQGPEQPLLQARDAGLAAPPLPPPPRSSASAAATAVVMPLPPGGSWAPPASSGAPLAADDEEFVLAGAAAALAAAPSGQLRRQSGAAGDEDDEFFRPGAAAALSGAAPAASESKDGAS